MADLKISQLATETDPTGQFVATAAAGANKKMDLGATIDAKIAALLAGTVTVAALRTNVFEDADGNAIADVVGTDFVFSMPVVMGGGLTVSAGDVDVSDGDIRMDRGFSGSPRTIFLQDAVERAYLQYRNATLSTRAVDIAGDFEIWANNLQTVTVRAEGELQFNRANTLAGVASGSAYRDATLGVWCFKGDDGYRTVLQNSFEYHDVVASSASNQSGVTTAVKLTNDGLNSDTYAGQLREYSRLWDTANSRIRANTDFKIGDFILFNFGCSVVTGVANTDVTITLKGYTTGGALIFTKVINRTPFKSAGTYQISEFTPIFIGPTLGDAGYFEVEGSADNATAFNNKSFLIAYMRTAR